MKAINSGLTPIKIITNGKPITLKKDEAVELDERTFDLLHKILPALIACSEVIIEADAQPIELTEPKAKKNAARKKSK